MSLLMRGNFRDSIRLFYAYVERVKDYFCLVKQVFNSNICSEWKPVYRTCPTRSHTVINLNSVTYTNFSIFFPFCFLIYLKLIFPVFSPNFPNNWKEKKFETTAGAKHHIKFCVFDLKSHKLTIELTDEI